MVQLCTSWDWKNNRENGELQETVYYDSSSNITKSDSLNLLLHKYLQGSAFNNFIRIFYLQVLFF